jgi:hypothetical protein
MLVTTTFNSLPGWTLTHREAMASHVFRAMRFLDRVVDGGVASDQQIASALVLTGDLKPFTDAELRLGRREVVR